MKYLMSAQLLAEDAEKFMREHKGGDFVNEYELDNSIQEALGDVCLKLYLATRISIDKEAMWDSVVKVLIDGIDAVVCYPGGATGYGRFCKKIIAVEKSEE